MKRIELGQYIVADPEICHDKLTFKGTRIRVEPVLRMVAKGNDWETIVAEYHHFITQDAITEAIQLASEALIEKVEQARQQAA